MKVRYALAGVTIGVGVIAVAPSLVSAHAAKIEVSCQTGINVDLSRYHGTDDHVTVWKDDNVIADTAFTGSFTFHRGFTRTEAHTWRVLVVAPGENSPDVSGTVQPCVDTTTTSTTTAPAESTTTSTTLELPTPSTPTTAPEIPCVLGPNGSYNFAGTTNPCEGPTPTTTTTVVPALDLSTPTPSGGLPETGTASTTLIAAAMALVAGGWTLVLISTWISRRNARRYQSWK